MKTRLLIFHLAICLFLLIIIQACADSPRGRLDYGNGVANLFTSATVIPDHTYYFFGRQSSPVAIIALKEEYQLESRLWTQLKEPDQALASLIEASRYQRNFGCTFSGALIITPDGSQGGYWYSKWDTTSIRTPEPGTIEVFPPVEPSSGPCKPLAPKSN